MSTDELDHLLKSLDDLDVELEEGRIDDETYAALHADYTARAAAVLRAERSGEAVARPAAPPVPLGRRLLVWGIVAMFVATTCALVIFALSPRDPGDPLTGDVGRGDDTETQLSEFEQHIQRARELNSEGQAFEALQAYDDATAADPSRSEGLTESGWMLRIAARQLPADDPNRSELLDSAETRLRAALRINDGLPDKYVFSGIFLCRDRGESEAAVPLLQEYQRLAPDSPMGPQVDAVLADAQADRCG